MIVWPGLRRSVSAIQRLFNSASFSAPLTHTLVPERGTGSPSFTRATTATGQKWDEAGYLDFTALAGEVVFKGARREYNLVTKSEDLTVGWTPNGTGSVTATTMVFTGAAGEGWNITGFTGTVGHVYQWQALMSVASGTHTMRFRVSGAALGEVTVTTTPTVFSFTATSVSASTIFGVYNGATPSAGTVNVTKMQLSDITGETDQTTIRPYVSVGAPSDWAGAELVTNGTFDTDTTWIKESGWTIGGGVATHAAGVSATLYQVFNFVAGATYVFSWDTVISAGAVSLRVGGGYLIPIDFKSASGTYTATYTAVTTATDLLGFVCDAPFAGTIDNFSVKPAIYHGSMVDGVKCYDTDRSGNPISTTGSYPLVGYVPWEARTNLCLQSQTFGTAPWANGGTAPTTTADAGVAPDGTATADRIAFPAASSLRYQNITLVAGNTYTASVYAKSFSGTDQTFRITATDFTQNSADLTATATWTRQTFTFTTASSSAQAFGVRTGVAAAAADILFYGFQVELGSFATPYIPTTTVAVARNASLLTYTGADVANIKTLACTFSRGVGVSGQGVQAALQSAAAVYGLTYLDNATVLYFQGADTGIQWQQTASNAYVPGTDSKIAWSMATNNIKMDKDGVAQNADVSASLPVVNALHVGHYSAGSLVFNGNIGPIYGWTRNLSQSELGAIDA